MLLALINSWRKLAERRGGGESCSSPLFLLNLTFDQSTMIVKRKQSPKKKKKTSPNFSETTGNITLVLFIYCIKLIFIEIYLFYCFFIFYHDDNHFQKQPLIKGCFSIGAIMPFPLELCFYWGYKYAFSIWAMFKDWI